MKNTIILVLYSMLILTAIILADAGYNYSIFFQIKTFGIIIPNDLIFILRYY